MECGCAWFPADCLTQVAQFLDFYEAHRLLAVCTGARATLTSNVSLWARFRPRVLVAWDVANPRLFLHAVALQGLIARYDLARVGVRKNRALCAAAKGGHLESLRILVKTFSLRAADVRANSNFALREAAAYGHLSTVKYLVETFDLTAADILTWDGYALRNAARHKFTPVVEYLTKKISRHPNGAAHESAHKRRKRST